MPARTAWRRRIVRWISIYVLLSLIGGIALAELQLHLQRRPLRHRDEVAVAVRSQVRGTLEDVQYGLRMELFCGLGTYGRKTTTAAMC